MNKIKTIEVDGVTYNVIIKNKWIKNVHFRFKDDHFEVTCNRLVPFFTIKGFLEKHAKQLMKKNASNNAVGEDFIYIFGEKYELTSPISIEEKVVEFANKEELNAKLKQLLLDYTSESLERYKVSMGITSPLKVRIKNSKRVLGSNSKRTNSISFAFTLIHFSKEIIDSVVVHELAHCFVFNHSKSFYDVVYKYCPNYNLYRKKLINSVFE